ncbi:MAG TPA: tetratricopeptide repeat protein, partial [Candidatus Saccharimonadales bacterium]|nr:tetratricopeptide repeat protein [Candidatus Saccharimonadales bacterium]
MLTKTLRSLWTETSPEKVIARAHKYLEKGRPDTAAGVLRDALEAGGEEPAIRMELSRILITMNLVRDACDGLKKFLKAHPDQAHQVQELLAWAKANHQEARSLNEVLAEHHVSRREFRAGFDALENLGKEALQALLDARLANLKRFLDKTPDAVPRSALPLIYLTALIHEAMGEDPHAVEVYQRIVSAHPKEIAGMEERLNAIKARHFRSASLRGALAAIYASAGDPDRAAQEMVEMVEIDPQLAPKAAETLRDLAEQAESPARIRMGIVRLFKIARDTAGLVGAARDLLAGVDVEAEELLALLEEVLQEGKSDPQLLLVTGETAKAAGRLPRAVSALSAACQEAPEEVRVRALRMMEKLFAEHPEETHVAEVLADQAIREGRLDDAVSFLSRLPLSPQAAPGIASRLQSILISLPAHAPAMDLLEKVSPHLNDPHLAVLFMRRRLREGPESARGVVEPIAQLLAKTPHDPLVRMAAIEARAASGDMVRAWEDLQPLLDGTTGPDPALLHLVVLVGGSSPELGREVAGGFRSMAPALAETPEGQFCLGEMAARAGDLPAALEAFRVAASFSPETAREAVNAARDLCGDLRSGEAAVSLADLFLDVGDYGGAASLLGSMEGLGVAAGPLVEKIEAAYRQDPDRADLRLALAAALAASGRTGHARKLIDEGIQRAGAAAPGALHIAAGDAWLRDGNLGDAVRSYSRAMAQDKSLAGETVRRLDRVLATDVGHAGGHLARGRGLLLDGNPREGVNSLLTAWSIKPSLGSTILKDLDYAARAFPLEPSVDLARAQITMGQGEVEAATAALGAALKTSPTMAPEVLSRLQAIIRSHPS